MKRANLIAGLSALLIGAASLSAVNADTSADGKRGHGKGMNFEELDQNGDGKLTMEELQARSAASFSEADADGDGKLSAEELAAHAEMRKAKRMENRTKSMMEKLDADGDGFLSMEELKAHERGADWFEKLDTDKDGALSKEELQAGHKGKGMKKGDHKGKRMGGEKSGSN